MNTQRHGTPVERYSADPTADRLAHLHDLYPEAFVEGKLDLDKFREALGDQVDYRPERYTFTWAGKRDAIRLLQTPTRATLVPCREESVNFDTTQHLFIEGDNLEVLKLLYKPYFGRVKMIYIDPPYNTGNDFIYPDNYTDPLGAYLQLTGQQDAEGNLLTTNPETSGRYHSAWLSMMYPRLFLARQLLREDGVIFVSIDDNEVQNLRLLMNEVFGEENLLATIVWQKKDTPSNDAKGFSVTHEYIVGYRRSDAFERGLLGRTASQLENYKNPDSDPRGPWTRTSLIRSEVRAERLYSVVNPKGHERFPPPGTSWRLPLETFAKLELERRIWWGADGDGELPFRKRFLSEVQQGVVPITWWDYRFAGSNRNAKMEIRDLFEREVPFETPKPSSLIVQLLRIATAEDDLVLDFFAGSATCAHGVLLLNREDGGQRRFVLIQLPEPTDNPQFPTVSSIGKERIRRVITRMSQPKDGQLPLDTRETPEDLGFRVFKLAPSHFQPWPGIDDSTPTAYAQQMTLFTDPLAAGWAPEPVLFEIALKEGYGLNCQISPLPSVSLLPAVGEGPGMRVYRVTDPDRGQSFTICLDPTLHPDTVEALHLAQDDLFICRDVALSDDLAANLALQCRLKTI